MYLLIRYLKKILFKSSGHKKCTHSPLMFHDIFLKTIKAHKILPICIFSITSNHWYLDNDYLIIIYG